MNAGIDRNHIETLFENRFLKVYDLQYAEGKHSFEASRRGAEDLVVRKEGEAFRGDEGVHAGADHGKGGADELDVQIRQGVLYGSVRRPEKEEELPAEQIPHRQQRDGGNDLQPEGKA